MATTDDVDDFPSVDELHQGSDPRRFVIPVEVVHPVRTEVLPGFTPYMGKLQVIPDDTPQLLVNENPSRRAITLIVIDEDVIIASSQSDAQNGAGARIPATLTSPLRMESMSEIWISPVVGAAATATVSFIIEQWAF